MPVEQVADLLVAGKFIPAPRGLQWPGRRKSGRVTRRIGNGVLPRPFISVYIDALRDDVRETAFPANVRDSSC